MARNTNFVVISGRLVRDVELNEAKTVGKFSLASSESVKNKEGKWEEYSNYFDVKIFGSTLKVVPYLTKGFGVTVTGTLHQDRWTKDGKGNSRVLINCSTLEFTGNKAKGDTPADTAASEGGSEPSGSSGDEFPEDIPF